MLTLYGLAGAAYGLHTGQVWLVIMGLIIFAVGLNNSVRGNSSGQGAVCPVCRGTKLTKDFNKLCPHCQGTGRT